MHFPRLFLLLPFLEYVADALLVLTGVLHRSLLRLLREIGSAHLGL